MFIEADDFHTPENISRMGKGQPLTDQVPIVVREYPNVRVLSPGQTSVAGGPA